MTAILVTLLLVVAGVRLGAIVFQSAYVAPVVFTELDEASASRFLRSLFPRFFKLGIACGASLLVVLLLAGFPGGFGAPLPLLIAIAAAVTALDAAALALVPAINAARDRGDAGAARFRLLHRLSVLATLIVLLLDVAFIAVIAGRIGSFAGPA
jgi:hypothetical protein